MLCISQWSKTQAKKLYQRTIQGPFMGSRAVHIPNSPTCSKHHRAENDTNFKSSRQQPIRNRSLLFQQIFSKSLFYFSFREQQKRKLQLLSVFIFKKNNFEFNSAIYSPVGSGRPNPNATALDLPTEGEIIIFFPTFIKLVDFYFRYYFTLTSKIIWILYSIWQKKFILLKRKIWFYHIIVLV